MSSTSLFIRIAAGIAFIALTGTDALAQQAAAPRNLIGNGSFETSFRRENLWNGVDFAGFLTGERDRLPVLTTAGTIAEAAMPVSVSLADMNNNGLLDIVTMDPIGYLRIYFNAGSPTEPKFEQGDLAGVFLSRIGDNDPVTAGTNQRNLRRGPRAHATKMFGSGKYDLLIGNYVGEVLALMNSGNVQSPDFRQPPDVGRLALPTSKDATAKWGNVFAPVAWDWNNNGRQDIILGEGSYSANNIHLLINQGGGARPSFDESNRHVLAFGDGLEQLSPAVVDYNGDGLPDLLVAERTGKIAVYLNKGERWNQGDPAPELPFASFVTTAAGAPMSFGGICTIAVGDLTGNGLFDIVVGKANGRIAVAYNKGTKTEPKFDAPIELKGTAGSPPMLMPSGWEVDYGLYRGNFLAYVSVVKGADDPAVDPADGQSFLKVGYSPSHNRVLPAPTTYLPALAGFNANGINSRGSPSATLHGAPARYFMLRQGGRFRFEVGKSYSLTMKVRGRASEGRIVIDYSGEKRLSEDRIVQGERGTAQVQRNVAREEKQESQTFSAGAAWNEVKKDFRVSFSNRDLRDLTQTAPASIGISFTLPPGGELYIDDIRLVEK